MELFSHVWRKGRGNKKSFTPASFDAIVPKPSNASCAWHASTAAGTDESNDRFQKLNTGECQPLYQMTLPAELSDGIVAKMESDGTTHTSCEIPSPPSVLNETNSQTLMPGEVDQSTSGSGTPTSQATESSMESFDAISSHAFLATVSAKRAAMSGRDHEGEFVERASVDLGVFSNFQGAWEQVRRRGDEVLQPWIRNFMITGRACYCGDCSLECLEQSDRDVLLCGGVLRMVPDGEHAQAEEHAARTTKREGFLTRTGRSGRTFMFRRVELPSHDSVKQLQGVWPITVNGESCRDEPCLRIFGRTWELDRDSGFLTVKNGNVMLDVFELRAEHGTAILSCNSRDMLANSAMCFAL